MSTPYSRQIPARSPAHSAAAKSVIRDLIANAERKIEAMQFAIENQKFLIVQLREELGDDTEDQPVAEAAAPPMAELSPPPAQATSQGASGVPHTGANRASELSVVKMMVVIMRGHAGPMRGAEITAELEKLGYVSKARGGLISNVFSELKRREDLFVKVDRGVYRLKT